MPSTLRLSHGRSGRRSGCRAGSSASCLRYPCAGRARPGFRPRGRDFAAPAAKAARRGEAAASGGVRGAGILSRRPRPDRPSVFRTPYPALRARDNESGGCHAAPHCLVTSCFPYCRPEAARRFGTCSRKCAAGAAAQAPAPAKCPACNGLQCAVACLARKRVDDALRRVVLTPLSWPARRCPADRAGEARGAMRGHRASALDAPCRPDSAARRVAPGRPPAASRAF